mmetsp:Transcript_50802/g.75287  ORF Transcript_50802/g.75287 Transcript_50802/m.75287 type:complete len:434 (-) Transcript_50802:422-1723(-)|eukprot:CAMPEP_0195525258 /NCGR_PEP_ID=MMETSP0794_2-20130614/25606_1 /TAXON_ID=515487 /ORGANISM="Stephanopyxis turris, Strain CCMP 815" /LENGTH=433 /DNA_ID=CAMNT_0040655677 /DNA_START=51 /DNA_END=1352 /DNA_ORIENTATION=-
MSSSKNDTRIASLMGSWTIDSTIKVSFGLYDLNVNIELFFMGDPLRENACELPSEDKCFEVDNKICLKESGRSTGRKCADMATAVSDWSDVNAFINIGYSMKTGPPLSLHLAADTGGWIGPFSTIFAQHKNFTNYQGSNLTNLKEPKPDASKVADHYSVRYVRSPIVPYLRWNPGSEMFNYVDFQNYFGESAVKNTVEVQHKMGLDDNGHTEFDPYAQYLNTCGNGNIKNILPLVEFEFLKGDPKIDNGREQLNIKLDYQLLTVPPIGSLEYKLMARLMKRGIPVTGPYCYEGELRGFLFDVTYASEMEHKYVHLMHGCVDDLPCLPSAAKLLSAASEAHVHEPPVPTTFNVGNVMLTSILLAVVIILLIVSLVWNVRLWRSRKRLQRSKSDDVECVPQMEMEIDNRTTPLLSDSNGHSSLERAHFSKRQFDM